MEPGLSDWSKRSPKKYLDRFVELVLDAYEPATPRPVEETLLAVDGPIDEVTWFALEDYSDHVVIYRGDNPDPNELRQLDQYQPNEAQMSQLRDYFREHYTYQDVEIAALIKIPDTYNPHLGRSPGVNIGVYHDPDMDVLKVGIKAQPPHHQQRVVEDVDKLVPGDDIEDFIDRINYELGEELLEEADQRIIQGNIQEYLTDDPDFRCETTKQIPKGIHPEYGGVEAEMWQKPASKVDYTDGSQGFLQVWIPVDDSDVGVVTMTQTDYEELPVVEEFCERYRGQESTVS